MAYCSRTIMAFSASFCVHSSKNIDIHVSLALIKAVLFLHGWIKENSIEKKQDLTTFFAVSKKLGHSKSTLSMPQM